MEKKNGDDRADWYASQPVYSLVCLIMAGYVLYMAELSLWIILPCGIVALVLWHYCEVQPIMQEKKFKLFFYSCWRGQISNPLYLLDRSLKKSENLKNVVPTNMLILLDNISKLL